MLPSSQLPFDGGPPSSFDVSATGGDGAGAAAGGVVLDLVGEGELERIGIELHGHGLAAAHGVFQLIVEFDQLGFRGVLLGHRCSPVTCPASR